jgi:hypothetical protein
VAEDQGGIDLSGLHRELDALKARLCRCGHQGNCLACKGFEVVRQQAQAVAAAASQPVLMQVAQEAAMRDLFSQLGGLQEKLTGDPELSDLMARFAERVQEDLGGPQELDRLLRSFGFMGPGQGPLGSAQPGGAGPVPYDDRPPTDRREPQPPQPGSPGSEPPERAPHPEDEPPPAGTP